MTEIVARYPLRTLFAEFPTALVDALEDASDTHVVTGWSTPIPYAAPVGQEPPILIVCDGRLRVHHPEDKDLVRVQAVLEAGRIWSGIAADRIQRLAPAPRAVYSVIPWPKFSEIFKRYPQLQVEIQRQLSEQFTELQDRLYESVLPVEERVVRELKRWGTRQKDGSVVTERITQQMLAGLVGSCRETVSRVVAAMERAGRLRHSGRGRGAGRYVLDEPKAAPIATAS